MADLYAEKITFKCDKCGKTFKPHRYLYRIHFDQLDVNEFNTRGRLSVQVCWRCNKDVQKFIFGTDEKDEEVTDET